MRKLLLFASLLIINTGISCNSQGNQKPPQTVAQTGGDIEVYYFHNTIRCVTCKTVEAEARKNLDLLYTEKVKKGEVTFTALNLEEGTGKTIAEKLGVNSQTLLIVNGNQKINITNEGFLYAVSQPEKFKEIMKSKIDPLIK
jgi:hypothetical protein